MKLKTVLISAYNYASETVCNRIDCNSQRNKIIFVAAAVLIVIVLGSQIFG